MRQVIKLLCLFIWVVNTHCSNDLYDHTDDGNYRLLGMHGHEKRSQMAKSQAVGMLSDSKYDFIRRSIPNLQGPQNSNSNPDYSIAVVEESKTIFVTFHISNFDQGWLLDNRVSPYVGNAMVHSLLYEHMDKFIKSGLSRDLNSARAKNPTYKVILSGFGASGAMAILYSVWIQSPDTGNVLHRDKVSLSLTNTDEEMMVQDSDRCLVHVIAFSPSRVGDDAFVSYARRVCAYPPLLIYRDASDPFYTVPTALAFTKGDVQFNLREESLIQGDIIIEAKIPPQSKCGSCFTWVYSHIYAYTTTCFGWIMTGLSSFSLLCCCRNSECFPSALCSEKMAAIVKKYAYFSRLSFLMWRWLEFKETSDTRSGDQLQRYGRATMFSAVEDEVKDAACIITVDQTIKEIIVAFRGTEGNTNWKFNLDVLMTSWEEQGAGVKVHEGFLKVYLSLALKLQEDLKSAIKQYGIDDRWRLTITGHSLGGALAAIATLDIFSSVLRERLDASLPNPECNLITYGQPRVGNNAFIQKLASVLPLKSYLRVVNGADLVPHVPPFHTEYVHGGYELWVHPYDQPREYPTVDWRIEPHEHASVGSNSLPDFFIYDHYFILGIDIGIRRFVYNIGDFQYWAYDSLAFL